MDFCRIVLVQHPARTHPLARCQLRPAPLAVLIPATLPGPATRTTLVIRDAPTTAVATIAAITIDPVEMGEMIISVGTTIITIDATLGGKTIATTIIRTRPLVMIVSFS